MNVRGTTWVAAVALVTLAIVGLSGESVLAQGNPANPADPINNPHPGMPWIWNGATRVFLGQVIRYIEVPAQQVVLSVAVSVPEGVPPRNEQQVQTIPGYYVAETTTGYWYPERWTLLQLNVGVYQWARVPAEFIKK